MDIKKLEEMREPSAMKMARENQARLGSLYLATGATGNLLKIAKDLDYFKSLTGYTTSQGLLSQLSQSNLAIDGSISGMLNTLSESSSLNPSLFESNKFNKAIIDAFKATHLGLKPPTQFILPEGFTSKDQIGDLSSVISKSIELFTQLEQFKKYSSFDVLSSLNEDFFGEILKTILTTDDVEEFSEISIAEIDAELSKEIKLGKDFNLYSEKAKKFLIYFYHIYLLQFLLGVASGLATYYILQAQEESKTLTTQQEVKAFTRSTPITFDRQALKGHRFTMINSLNFRDKPSMNSNVIDSLPIGTTVRVIDKSDLSWLLVEVEINGELEQGWVLRRYTTYFK